MKGLLKAIALSSVLAVAIADRNVPVNFRVRLDAIHDNLNTDGADNEWEAFVVNTCNGEDEQSPGSASLTVESMTACAHAEFLESVFDLEREKARAVGHAVAEEGKSTRLTANSYNDLSFANFFFDFEVERHPVVIEDFPALVQDSGAAIGLISCSVDGKFDLPNGATTPIGGQPSDFIVSNITELLPMMQGTDGNNSIYPSQDSTIFRSIDPNDELCASFNASEALSLPKYVVNDYMRRMHRYNESTDIPTSKYASYSVQAAFLQSSQTIPPSHATCPSTLHGLFTVLGTEVDDKASASSRSISARIFNPRHAPELRPFIDVNGESFPAYWTQYELNGWNGIDPDKYEHISIGSGTALFVPSGSVVTFQSEDEGNGTAKEESCRTAGGVLLLRFCFLDASNLNDFKRHLRAESLIDPASRELLDQLSRPTFDTSMQRDVPSLSSWNEIQSAEDSGVAAVTKDDDDSLLAPHRRLKRGRRQRGAFAEWQLQRSWDYRVIGITLPPPSTPKIIDSGRRNVTLGWTCPFSTREGDTTAVGYVIEWSGHESEDGNPPPPGGNFTFEESWNDQGETFRVEVATDTDGVPVRKLTGVIASLEAASRYTFKVALVYGNDREKSISLFSPPSEVVITDPPGLPFPLSSPPMVLEPSQWDELLGKGETPFVPNQASDATFIVLEMRSPWDDGGLDIIGYDVMRLQMDPAGHKSGEWMQLTQGIEELTSISSTGRGGIVVRLGVHNLLPGGSYLFKVAARNKLGRSPWSASSGPARTISASSRAFKSDRQSAGHGFVPKGGHYLHGVGSNPLSSPMGHVRRGPIVTLDDSKQIITMNGLTHGIEVWTNYWSPRGFKVSAETREVKWGSQGEVLNAADVQFRLGVISREDGTPLVNMALAAQKAGAFGVIFVDNGARCLEFDQFCILGSSKADRDYWAEHESAWKTLMIPVVMAKSEGAHGKTREVLLPAS